MNKELITEEWLKKNGWQKRLFFYAIGGGEDENDRDIWVKDGVALTYEYTYKKWCKASYEELNYVNGFPDNDIVIYTDEL